MIRSNASTRPTIRRPARRMCTELVPEVRPDRNPRRRAKHFGGNIENRRRAPRHECCASSMCRSTRSPHQRDQIPSPFRRARARRHEQADRQKERTFYTRSSTTTTRRRCPAAPESRPPSRAAPPENRRGTECPRSRRPRMRRPPPYTRCGSRPRPSVARVLAQGGHRRRETLAWGPGCSSRDRLDDMWTDEVGDRERQPSSTAMAARYLGLADSNPQFAGGRASRTPNRAFPPGAPLLLEMKRALVRRRPPKSSEARPLSMACSMMRQYSRLFGHCLRYRAATEPRALRGRRDGRG